MEWDPELVRSAQKYQQSLQKRRDYKAKMKASLSSKDGINPSCDAPSPQSGSACGSHRGSAVGLEDSVSQVPGPAKASPCDMSAFFQGFASFLGLPDDGHVNFPSMLFCHVNLTFNWVVFDEIIEVRLKNCFYPRINSSHLSNFIKFFNLFHSFLLIFLLK